MLNILSLRRELMDLVGDAQYDELFRRLKLSVINNTENALYVDIILVESRYSEAKRAGNLNLIEFKELHRDFSNVAQALSWLIGRITEGDLNETLRQMTGSHRAVSPRHRYTCDRTEQTDLFQLYHLESTDKIRFFYLYGDVRQEHESLFQRLGYELGGHLLNWREGNFEPTVRLKFVDFKPPVHENPKLFQLNVLRELFAHFSGALSASPQLLTKTVKDLLDSAALREFGADDFVFILLTVDDYNWRGDATVRVVRSLYETFCACELPPGAPTFFFFFGVEYRKENETVKAQVRAAINQAELGHALPELEPVSKADLAQWFSKYHVLRTPGKEPDAMAESLFPGQSALDMADVELKLTEIIENHNKGLIINFK